MGMYRTQPRRLLALIASLALIVGCATADGTKAEKSVSNKGTLASVNKGENTVSLIDLGSGKTLTKLGVGPSPQEVVFSPSGKIGVVSNMGLSKPGEGPGKTLSVIDLEGKKIKSEIQLGAHGAPHGLIFLDEDKVLMTSHATDSLVMVDLKEGKVEKALSTQAKGTHLVVLSPDKKFAYTISAFSEEVSVIDLAKWEVTKKIKCGARAEGMSISPDGKWMAVGNIGADTVTVIDLGTNEVVKTLSSLALPIRTFFTSDSKHMLVACANSGEIAVFDSKTLEEKKRIKLANAKGVTLTQGPFPMPMNFEADRKNGRIYSVLINADAVAVIDEKSLEVVGILATGSFPDGIGFTPLVMPTS